MKEGSPGTVTAPPTVQKMQRLRTIEKEHKDALERAVSLNVPHAVEAAEDEANEREEEEEGEEEYSEEEEYTEEEWRKASEEYEWVDIDELKLRKKMCIAADSLISMMRIKCLLLKV